MTTTDFAGNKSYEKVMKASKTLFWKHGIRRVTVEEICKEAGVSKMTFYRFFSNKKDCALKVLTKVGEEALQQYRAIMHDETLPFVDRIRGIIQQKFESTDQVSKELIKDLYQNPQPELLEYMTQQRQVSLAEFMTDLSDAQAKGWIRKDVKPEFMMHYLHKAQEMVQDPAVISLYDTMQDLAMEITNFFFFGIGVSESSSHETT